MKLQILNTQGTPVGEKELPAVFNTPLRTDIILRANLAIASHERQPYGADPRAGAKTAAKLSRRRRKYKTAYGHGISRSPRKIMSRNGERMNWRGAFAPNTVGGRMAFAPNACKNWYQKINDKERKVAVRSAMAAVMQKELVLLHGHKLPPVYPFLISNEFESLDKSSKVVEAFEKLGLANELERCSERKIRSGKGKNRGRPYVHKVGPLLVVSGHCKLITSARNIQGVQVIPANRLNTRLLAPGSKAGRLTLFTQAALEKVK
ncbi:MAG: 50S ribosomal protein L4 [Candidatus Aenigmarchaeota archaeon]|nr:50S ribosomal protein L4 [Candidatus Aenigmarchaeota archaeon]